MTPRPTVKERADANVVGRPCVCIMQYFDIVLHCGGQRGEGPTRIAGTEYVFIAVPSPSISFEKQDGFSGSCCSHIQAKITTCPALMVKQNARIDQNKKLKVSIGGPGDSTGNGF